MKKFILSIVIAFFVVTPIEAEEVFREHIESFDVDITIKSDSSISVVEKVHYNFLGKKNHGIYREIPLLYKSIDGRSSIGIDDIVVTDEENSLLQYEVKREGGKVRIKIGSPDVQVSGSKIYNISYSARDAVRFFDTYDELYWNVTGDDWIVPILSASTRVHLPMNSTPQKVECFVGSAGSTKKCKASILNFSTGEISPGQGMTIVAGFPKEVLMSNVWQNRLIWYLRNNLIIFLPFAVFLMFFTSWFFLGRDPRMNSIVPQWEIPDFLTPFALGILFDEKLDQRDLSSLFVDLAIRGYFSIEKYENDLMPGRTDYIFVQKKSWSDDTSLEHFERLFLEELFRGGDLSSYKFHKGNMVKLSDLGVEFRKAIKMIVDLGYKSLVDRVYYKKVPLFMSMPVIHLGGIAAIAGVIIASVINGGKLISLFCIIISLVISYAFIRNMSRKTRHGVRAKEKILGLKMYIESAEERRIKLFNGQNVLPLHNRETFEKYLPYAMVLGVEKSWIEEFGDVSGGFTWSQNVQSFTSMISSFSAASGVTTVSQVTTGGSGFSGGASGGGRGGGGGGSW